ncbi:heme peroxidase [Panus rudis PR-1116 ss-1]|nr:heme peroxidase [Panus rudis PR-1116 ss-1]
MSITESKIVGLADALHNVTQPLPKANDGRYDWQVKATTEASPYDSHSKLYKVAQDIQDRIKKGPILKDANLINAALQALKNKDAIDDRTRLFNQVMYIVGRLPQGSELSQKLNDVVVSILYETVPHPPATFLGTNTSAPGPFADASSQSNSSSGKTYPFAFRSADGGGNNPYSPGLGQAGRPYARSVQSKHPLPPNTLPEPGLVFDLLLKARDFKPHPGGNSSLTFAYASLVTHQLFRTDPRDQTKNNTSSYLDLSVLYGRNQQEQDLVRDKASGRGLLWPDAFAEDRLVLVPPAASALLVVFSRNHNYIANMLLQINERGRWTDPPPEDPTKRADQDEEIFQTARLVNCGHYMSTIFGDYVAGFLGLGREGNSWSMNPFDPINLPDGPVSRGEGNHCSVEFNLLYRWHSTTAEKDIKWTEELFSKVFNGKAPSELELSDFLPGVANAWREVDPNPRTRTFGGLKRGPDGKFSDDDLAQVLQDATEKVAGSYRARGTPPVLRIIEILAIQQARNWGVCTMNEFRKFLGLKQFADFEDWNRDPTIANAARQLYGHIDNLELYPGLQAEEIIPLGPGSGICCGYTMTRAILGDAIALVRGDRFYTTDYTPGNLTVWGFQDCARDPNNGAFGAALPKLLFRHLPRHYPANSIYGLFPFFTPDTTRENLKKLGVLAKYNDKRPVPQPIPKVVNTLKGIRYVFDNFETFKTTYSEDMLALTNHKGFMLIFDEKEKHDRYRLKVIHALFNDKPTVDGYVRWYRQKTEELVKEYSYTLDGIPGTRVDIVRNVINLVATHWAASYLMGVPLKTKADPHGLFTEQELYDILMLLCTCVFINVQPETGWMLRANAQQIGDTINELIEKSIIDAAPRAAPNRLSTIFGLVSSFVRPAEGKLCYPFLRRLSDLGLDRKDMVAQVIGLAVGSSVNYAQSIAQVVDFYLDDARAAERAEISKLVHRNDAEATELLHGYIREGQRLAPQFPGLLRVAAKADSIPLGDDLPNLAVQPGDIIFSSFFNAQRNPNDFPDPLTVNPRRPKDQYQNQGAGFHVCPGIDFTLQTATEIMRVVFSLPNIRRAPGPAGSMPSFTVNQLGTDNRMYLTNTGGISPWPGSLIVVYDS